MHRCGAPPVMKAGEPDPHTCPGLALAWRARTGEKGLSQRTQRRELTHATTKRRKGSLIPSITHRSDEGTDRKA